MLRAVAASSPAAEQDPMHPRVPSCGWTSGSGSGGHDVVVRRPACSARSPMRPASSRRVRPRAPHRLRTRGRPRLGPVHGLVADHAASGRRVVACGPSGVGKTTLALHLGGRRLGRAGRRELRHQRRALPRGPPAVPGEAGDRRAHPVVARRLRPGSSSRSPPGRRDRGPPRRRPARGAPRWRRSITSFCSSATSAPPPPPPARPRRWARSGPRCSRPSILRRCWPVPCGRWCARLACTTWSSASSRDAVEVLEDLVAA